MSLDEEAAELEQQLAVHIAANVRHLRIERGWTQKNLADELTVGVASVQQLEGARYRPGLKVLCRLAVIFGIQPADLMAPRERAERPPGRPRET